VNNSPKRKIVLAIGSGRSGTTLLGSILGSIEEAVDLGEVALAWERGAIGNERCTCGRRFWDCRLWSPAAKDAVARWDAGGYREAARVTAEATRIRTLVESSARRRAEKGCLGSTGNQDISKYNVLLRALYESLFELSGARILVDTSKRPGHAAIVAQAMCDVDVMVLHTVRDSRAVAYSMSRVKDRVPGKLLNREGVVKSSIHWVGMNLVCEWVTHRFEQRPGLSKGFIRYETLAKVLSTEEGRHGQVSIGAEKHPVSVTQLRRGKSHSVSGNPIRLNEGHESVRMDDEWRSEMGSCGRWVVSGITWPLLRRYGYLPLLRGQAWAERREELGR
jgi:hypothetical protein